MSIITGRPRFFAVRPDHQPPPPPPPPPPSPPEEPGAVDTELMLLERLEHFDGIGRQAHPLEQRAEHRETLGRCGGGGDGLESDGSLVASEEAAVHLSHGDLAMDAKIDERGCHFAIVDPHLHHIAHATGPRSSGGEKAGTTVPGRGSQPSRR